MVDRLFQTRLNIQGFFIPENQLNGDQIWLIKNVILLKQIEHELSVFVVSAGTEDYSEHDAEEDAKRKISPYLVLYSLLTNKTPTIVSCGTRPINSKTAIGKPPYSVRSGFAFSSRTGLSKTFLEGTKLLNNQIATLNRKFLFLETAGLYYYYASAIEVGQIEKLSTKQFIDAAISLESLFNDGSGDITYKICLRTALLLGLLDHMFDSINVFNTMKDLYALRNDIVHGGARKKEEYTHKNANTILCLAKNALICCYILSLNRQDQSANNLKKNLLYEIDMSLLDLSRHKRLGKEIVRGLKRFSPS